MAHKIVTEDTWIQIKTDYQLGIGLRELERKYNIAKSTIGSRCKKEGWLKSTAKLVDAVNAVANFAQDFGQEQLPYVQEKLNDVLDLQTKIKSFIACAVDVNLKNMQEVANEPDVKDRIRMMSIMRANMSDLANVYPTTVKEADKEDKQEDKVINLIME